MSSQGRGDLCWVLKGRVNFLRWRGAACAKAWGHQRPLWVQGAGGSLVKLRYRVDICVCGWGQGARAVEEDGPRKPLGMKLIEVF